jgi:dCTP deaminase
MLIARKTVIKCVHMKGALAIQHIKQLIAEKAIFETRDENLQPSSMDLSLSGEIYRMKGSFLPQKQESIRDILRAGILFPVSLAQPLELNGIYYVRLNESLNLPSHIYAVTNNKSSSGRVNLQTRLLVNGTPSFDYVPRGYQGELWLEVIPKSFPVLLSYGERLNQMRFFSEDTKLSEAQYREQNARYGFLRAQDGTTIELPANTPLRGITMSIDLAGPRYHWLQVQPNHHQGPQLQQPQPQPRRLF